MIAWLDQSLEKKSLAPIVFWIHIQLQIFSQPIEML